MQVINSKDIFDEQGTLCKLLVLKTATNLTKVLLKYNNKVYFADTFMDSPNHYMLISETSFVLINTNETSNDRIMVKVDWENHICHINCYEYTCDGNMMGMELF